MSSEPNRFELIGYLEEALDVEDMARVEERLRTSSEWTEALRELTGDIDSGEHSVATIWRRHRLTCPSRERLGAYSMGGLPHDEEDYVKFHLEVIKCRWCKANVCDLQTNGQGDQQQDPEVMKRRRRLFASSVGRLADDRE